MGPESALTPFFKPPWKKPFFLPGTAAQVICPFDGKGSNVRLASAAGGRGGDSRGKTPPPPMPPLAKRIGRSGQMR